MRVARVLVLLVSLLALPAPGAHARELDEDNIFAEDVREATDVLARMERRLADAQAAAQAATNELPAAMTDAVRLDRRARRAQEPASRAAVAADRAQAAAVEAREDAAMKVARTRAVERAELASWRAHRATWIGFAGAALAGALAFLAAWAVARVRCRTSRERAADVVGLGLGVVVTGSLSALLAALLVADAWMFSWTLVLAAVANTLLWVIAAVVGWLRADALSKVGRAAAPVAVLLLVGACVPVAVAAGQERPARATLDSSVVALAAAHADGAGMPVEVTRLQRRARSLQDRANAARQRAEWAADERDDLYDERASADERAAGAQRSIDRWTAKLADAREEYDDYQELLDIGDELDAELNLGDDDPSFPTTEDFGSGLGSVGMCRDGTLSDSIGRPGACSHHGGVAP